MNHDLVTWMSIIATSKMYKSSNRKSSIMAAIKNPVNVQLVEQLNEYVGEDYQYLLDDNTADLQDDVSTDVEEDGLEDTAETSSTDEPESAPSQAPARQPLHEKYADELQESPDMPEDQPSEPVESEPESADASTNVSDKPIMADTSVIQEESSVTLAGIAGEIKGILNSRNETNGVARVSVKKADEVWIFYNDSINLNTVMEPVICILAAASYHYLDFNRLARTENAIVFTINSNVA